MAAVDPSENVPSPFTVRSRPELEERLLVVNVVSRVNQNPLKFCPTVVGSMMRFSKVTVTELALVVIIAFASTELPPGGVVSQPGQARDHGLDLVGELIDVHGVFPSARLPQPERCGASHPAGMVG